MMLSRYRNWKTKVCTIIRYRLKKKKGKKTLSLRKAKPSKTMQLFKMRFNLALCIVLIFFYAKVKNKLQNLPIQMYGRDDSYIAPS